MGLADLPGGGKDFSHGQIRARILGDGQPGLRLGGQDQSYGALDLAGGQFLLARGEEEGHLQNGGQATKLKGGDGAGLSGLDERPEIFEEASDEPQATQDPGMAPPQEPGYGVRLHAVVIGQIFDQSRFFPQGNGATAGIEREHQGLGLLDIAGDNTHGYLS